jgi:hypothetical protein
MPMKTRDTGQLTLPTRGSRASRLDRTVAKSQAGHVFLVRLWRETRDDSRLPSLWRGTVSDLRGRHLGNFGVGEELIDILIDSSKATAILRRCNDNSLEIDP